MDEFQTNAFKKIRIEVVDERLSVTNIRNIVIIVIFGR